MMKFKPSYRALVAATFMTVGLACGISAHASVVLAGTRVVYNAKDAEETLKLSNQGNSPALVQAWIDTGDAKAAPSSINVPFTVTPPISRIDPTKAQTLRIIYTGEALPQDRESVFWLNVLEVPPKDSGDTNKLQLAFRTRIKLFFRPAGLKGTAADAPSQLVWHLTRRGKQLAIEARNPTPYYVSLTEVEVGTGDRMAKFNDGGMVGPGEAGTFPLGGEAPGGSDVKVHYKALNDYGGAITGDTPLNAQALPDSSN